MRVIQIRPAAMKRLANGAGLGHTGSFITNGHWMIKAGALWPVASYLTREAFSAHGFQEGRMSNMPDDDALEAFEKGLLSGDQCFVRTQWLYEDTSNVILRRFVNERDGETTEIYLNNAYVQALDLVELWGSVDLPMRDNKDPKESALIIMPVSGPVSAWRKP